MKALSTVIALLFLSFNITFAASAHNLFATGGNSHQTAYVGNSDSDSEEEEEEEEITVEEKICNHRFKYTKTRNLFVANACIYCNKPHPYLGGPAPKGTLTSCASRTFRPKTNQCPHCSVVQRPDNLQRHIKRCPNNPYKDSTYNRNRRELEQEDDE